MPAIKPSVLNEKINAIFDRSLDAESFPEELDALLRFYADRTKRPNALAAALEPAEILRVPTPVLRALCTKIHQRGQREDDEWLEAAEQLWRSGLREMRQVSICMLNKAPVDQALEIAVIWAAECDDPYVLRSLANEGMSSCREAQLDEVMESIERLLAEDTTRAFGLMALKPIIEEASFSDLPYVFDLLKELPSSVRGLELEALQGLLRSLAGQSPAETTAFLLNEIRTDDLRSTRLIRSILSDLPAPFQSQLGQAL